MRKFLTVVVLIFASFTLFAGNEDVSVTLGDFKRLSSTTYSYASAKVTGDIKSISITVDSGSFSIENATADISDLSGKSRTYFVDGSSAAQEMLRKAVFTQDSSTSIATQKVTIAVSSGVTDFSELPSGSATPKMSQAIIDNVLHYYAFVPYSNINFSDAYAKAKQLKFNGLKGYLATILSSVEDIIMDNITSNVGWAGGALVSEANASLNGDTFSKDGNIFPSLGGYNSPFRWVCGPEAGTAFSYSNWATGEPTGLNIKDNEYCLQIHYSTSRLWNDLYVTSQIGGFFVEWSENTRTEGSGKTMYCTSAINKIDLRVSYVKDTGSDSTGDGSLEKPFATINKAYSINDGFCTIALLSDITASSKLSIGANKELIILSAQQDGSLVNNEPGDYLGVYTIHRGNLTEDLILMDNTASLTLKQVILDGDKKEIATFLINETSGSGNAIVTLDTNCILRDNIATGSNGTCWGSGIRMGTEKSSYTPKLYMKSNSKITGCIAPRHGGAITTYAGDVYMQDDSLIEYNGINFYDVYTSYYGGGAILCYGGNLHMSGNSKITKNFVQLNGGQDNGRKHNALQADPNTVSKVYISGNAKIFDNYDDGILTYEGADGYKLIGNVRANAYAKNDAFYIDGELGPNAKIGLTIENAVADSTVIIAGTNYHLSDTDLNAFFEDSGNYSFYRDGDSIKLSGVKAATLSLNFNNSKELVGVFSLDIKPSSNDFSIFKNGEKMDDGYTVTVNGKYLKIGFSSELENHTVIGVSVSKNGYNVNQGQLVEATYEYHVHEWVFSSNGSKIQAICVSQDNFSKFCNFKNPSNAIVLEFATVGFGSIPATISPLTASESKLVWATSNPSFVVDENGNVTASEHGTSTVTATATDGSGISASCLVIF